MQKRVISLFGGVGGFDLPLKRNGWKEVGYYEIDKYCTQVYNYNFGTKHKPTDITKVRTEDIAEHDLLCAGIPCQPFSIAGRRQGFTDIRGTLYAEFVRFAKAKRPRVLLIEKVRGLLSIDSGRCFHTILVSLAELGYCLEWQIINSRNYTRQNRDRVYIIGHLGERCPYQIFPIKTNYQEDIILQGQPIHTNTICARYYGAQANGSYIIEGEYNEVSEIHKKARIRRLTPTECEILQGYPKNWTKHGMDECGKKTTISDAQRYKMMGNAVTVNVIDAIIKAIDKSEAKQ